MRISRFEALEARWLLTQISALTFLDTPSEAISLSSYQRGVAVGFNFANGETAVQAFADFPQSSTLQELQPVLPGHYQSAQLRSLDSTIAILEAQRDLDTDLLTWDLATNAVRLVKAETSLIDAALDELYLLDDEGGPYLLGGSLERDITHLDQALGLSKRGEYLFGRSVEGTPLATRIVRTPSALNIGLSASAESPQLPEGMIFWGTYRDSFQLAHHPATEAGVFEYVTIVDDQPQLALAVADFASGELLQDLGVYSGLEVFAENGTVVVNTFDSAEIWLQSEHIATLLGLPLQSRASLQTLLPSDISLTRVIDIETDGLAFFSFLAEVTDETGALQTILFGARETSPASNEAQSLDTTRDGFISPIDVLVVINFLNSRGSQAVDLTLPEVQFFYDANRDGFISPLDALVVINYLNVRSQNGEGEASDSLNDTDSEVGLRSLEWLNEEELVSRRKRPFQLFAQSL